MLTNIFKPVIQIFTYVHVINITLLQFYRTRFWNTADFNFSPLSKCQFLSRSMARINLLNGC